MKRDRKEPLYRKENKTSLYTHYYVHTGEDFRHDRNTKKMKEFEGDKKPMNSGKYGYDYTPLMKFLISKVGKKWDDVYSEAISRLNDTEPIFWLVYLKPTKNIVVRQEDSSYSYELTIPKVVRVGESTYYHALTVDENGILVFVDKTETIEPSCTCCTHSLDGKVVKKQ
jgi:hypothetical protein